MTGHPSGQADAPAKPRIEMVVEDIDNTKYDFFGTWAASVTKALETLAAHRAGPDPQAQQAWMRTVKDDIRAGFESGAIHAGHVFHDMAEVILRTPTLNPQGRYHPERNPGGREELAADEQEAVNAWQRIRQHGLKPFEGVRETLKAVSDAGAKDVAWTDAQFSSLAGRLPKLFGGDLRAAGIKTVYCQPDASGTPSDAAVRAAEKAIGAEIVVLSPEKIGVPDTAKPCRESFEYILAREGVAPGRALIVGDHFRDFLAAQWRDGGGALLPAGQRPVGVWQEHGADGEPLATRDGSHTAAVPARAVPLVLEITGERAFASYPLGAQAIRDRIGTPFDIPGRDGSRQAMIAPPDLVIAAGQGARGYGQLLDLVTVEPARPRVESNFPAQGAGRPAVRPGIRPPPRPAAAKPALSLAKEGR